MMMDQSVYITIVNFNMRRTTIDIDEQFYPLPSKAEILIDSKPYRPSSYSSKISSKEFLNEIDLSNIELKPFESLIIRINPLQM